MQVHASADAACPLRWSKRKRDTWKVPLLSKKWPMCCTRTLPELVGNYYSVQWQSNNARAFVCGRLSQLTPVSPSSSFSMKSIRWETSSCTASMWSSRLICLCWCCLPLSAASWHSSFPSSFSSLISVGDVGMPMPAWGHSGDTRRRFYKCYLSKSLVLKYQREVLILLNP